MKVRIGLTLGFLGALGCSHTSRNDSAITKELAPPDRAWVQARSSSKTLASSEEVAPQTQGQRWWFSYKRGQKAESSSPEISCTEYTFLSTQKDFPLWDLAGLKAEIFCLPPSGLSKPLTDTKSLSEKTDSLSPSDFSGHSPGPKSPWYSNLELASRELQAQKTPELKDDIEVLLDRAREESKPLLKENFFRKALEFAEKSRDSEQIQIVKEKWQKVFPRHLLHPPPEKWLEVAQDHRQSREFARADFFYRQILKSKVLGDEIKWAAWRGLRQVAKTQQNKKELIRRDQQIEKWLESKSKSKKDLQTTKKKNIWWDRWYDHRLLQARTLWTEDRTKEAEKHLLNTLEIFRDRHSLEENYFILARMSEEKRKDDEALQYLQSAQKVDFEDTSLREKILWTQAWLQYKLKRTPEALQSFSALLNLPLEPANRSKILFWNGRAQSAAGLKEEAKNTFELLTREDPLGFYGLLAHRELQRPLPPLPSPKTDEEVAHLRGWREISLNTGLRLDWLISLGEKEILESALKKTLEEIRSKSQPSSQSWMRYYLALAEADIFLPLFSNLNKISFEDREKLWHRHSNLLFPRPFSDLVSSAAAQAQINDSLVYSIMRQESAFDPQARSAVDAFGLLQLLPTLGEKLAKKSGVNFSRAEDLFEPSVNIPLGTQELRGLSDRYKGRLILSICAYNANDRAIQGWLKTRFRPDPVEFIEEIPYEETRSYVKLVMRNFIFYERLKNQQKPLDFPENLLQWPPVGFQFSHNEILSESQEISSTSH